MSRTTLLLLALLELTLVLNNLIRAQHFAPLEVRERSGLNARPSPVKRVLSRVESRAFPPLLFIPQFALQHPSTSNARVLLCYSLLLHIYTHIVTERDERKPAISWARRVCILTTKFLPGSGCKNSKRSSMTDEPQPRWFSFLSLSPSLSLSLAVFVFLSFPLFHSSANDGGGNTNGALIHAWYFNPYPTVSLFLPFSVYFKASEGSKIPPLPGGSLPSASSL